MMNRIWRTVVSIHERMTRHRLILGTLIAALSAGVLALYNVSLGPLHNLNDIGGWSNRALFIVMAAAVHVSLLMLCVCMSRVCFARTALRQMIVNAGFYIMLLAINHKTYHYVNVIQPVVRAMDAGGLAAGAAMESGMPAPVLLITYLLTRGPVYDMYLLKLFAIACYVLLALLIVRYADRRALGIRAETLLALCMILPQGFMNAACSSLMDVAAVAFLGAALTLAFDMDKPHMYASSVCYGAACALSGACLFALPAYLAAVKCGKMKKAHLLAAAGVMLALCVPAVTAGIPAGRALGSLFLTIFGLPAYASGAPGVMNLVPRAVMEEMPQYAPILRHFETLDAVTHAQPYYTPAHFVQLASGMVFAALALGMGAWAVAYAMKDKKPAHRLFVLVLGVLIACPNVTSGAWLAIDMVCLYLLLAMPKLRLPACMVLAATACSSVYPMTEEVMLPMIYAFILCLLALCMTTGVIPMERKENGHE